MDIFIVELLIFKNGKPYFFNEVVTMAGFANLFSFFTFRSVIYIF